ncbi:MAG: AAA family ATPase [Sulfuricurvum sp.]
MNDHFIKNIEIKNFKCFEEFTAEGFGRVNLIGGKNNVGKTAFMEACYVNVQAKILNCFIFSLQSIKYMRENLNILENSAIDNVQTFVEQSNHIFISSNINQIHFRIDENDGIKKYHFEFNQQIIDVNAKDFSFALANIYNIQFIDNFGFNNTQLKNGYLSVQKKDQEQFLNDILNQFDARIEKFIGGDTPQCRVNGAWLDLTELGDGARHLVSIVVSLFRCENGTLFIDELDNGIHYTQLDELWKIILTVSKEQNVQVFATTHSKECIESYARVAKKLADEEVTYSLLTRLKSGKLHHSLYDYALLENAIIEQAHEVR